MALTADIPNILTISGAPCFGGKLSNMAIQANGLGSGTVFKNTAGTSLLLKADNYTIENFSINGPCVGIDLNGNTVRLQNFQITQVTGVGCGGIRVGHYTTGGATADPRIENGTVQACPVFDETGAILNPCFNVASSVTADYGIRYEDAGGAIVSFTNVIYPLNGTEILPGPAQYVTGSWNSDNLGDTVHGVGLLIDDLGPGGLGGGVAVALNFNNSFTAAFLSNTGSPGILIRNTGNVPVTYYQGINFRGQTVLETSGPSMKIEPAAVPFTGSIAGGTPNVLTVATTTGSINNLSTIVGSGRRSRGKFSTYWRSRRAGHLCINHQHYAARRVHRSDDCIFGADKH